MLADTTEPSTELQLFWRNIIYLSHICGCSYRTSRFAAITDPIVTRSVMDSYLIHALWYRAARCSHVVILHALIMQPVYCVTQISLKRWHFTVNKV